MKDDYSLEVQEAECFNFIYKSLHLVCHCQHWIDAIMPSITSLERFIGTTKDHSRFLGIRDIVHAFLIKEINPQEKTSFDISQLQENDKNAIRSIIVFCVKFEYFPWDLLDNYKQGYTLASQLLETGQLTTKNQKLAIKEIDKCKYYLSVAATTVRLNLSQSFREEILSDYIEVNKKLYTNKSTPFWSQNGIGKKTINIESQIYKDENITQKNINIYGHTIKKLEKLKYNRQRCLWPRFFGLMLWHAYFEIGIEKGYINLATEDVDEAIETISTIDMYNKLTSKEVIQNLLKSSYDFIPKEVPSDRNLQRWFLATKKSIEAGEYVDIEG